jgi:hypothetical protein
MQVVPGGGLSCDWKRRVQCYSQNPGFTEAYSSAEVLNKSVLDCV